MGIKGKGMGAQDPRTWGNGLLGPQDPRTIWNWGHWTVGLGNVGHWEHEFTPTHLSLSHLWLEETVCAP